MLLNRRIALVLPALDEEGALPGVLDAVPAWVDEVVVGDNGSRDGTAAAALRHGARVAREPRRGYGRACLAALGALEAAPPDIVAFADADGSDDVARLADLVAPIAEGHADFVLESRDATSRAALSPQQRLGNRLATALIRALWRHDYADLGPMRAISWSALGTLAMAAPGCGWTVEMQVRALASGLRVREVPLPYRPRRSGSSKISRTLLGTVRAGAAILAVIGREAWRGSRGAPPTPRPRRCPS
ncbi:MAG: glycosyltransferase family 2 protein [Deltaproteobacteria bacterium]|nr:glycosyltransferase family 2 protein [Deltaproteobacteria bacterium]